MVSGSELSAVPGTLAPKRMRFSLRQLMMRVTVCACSLGLLIVIQRYDRTGWERTSSYQKDLDSRDADTVLHGFYFLTVRKDPVAVPRAIELLNSTDSYIWFNSALYLGACDRQEAVPYLVKGLRHRAWRSYPEIASDLSRLTKQNFGTDYSLWFTWWQKQPHFDANFDWDTHLGF
jgi:hypothetical protein